MARLGWVLKRLLAHSFGRTTRFLAVIFNYLAYPFIYLVALWSSIHEYFSNPHWFWNLFFRFLQWLFDFICLHGNEDDCGCFHRYDDAFKVISLAWEARIAELQADLEDRRERNTFLEALRVMLEEKLECAEEKVEVCEENHDELKQHAAEAWENRCKMALLERENTGLKERLQRYNEKPPGGLIQSQESKLMQVNLDLHRQIIDLEGQIQTEIDRRQKGLAVTILEMEKKALENLVLQLRDEISDQRDELTVCQEILADRESIESDLRNAKGEIDYWKRQSGEGTEGPSKWEIVDKYEKERKKVDDCLESKVVLIAAYDAVLRARKDIARVDIQKAQMERDMVIAQLKAYQDSASEAFEERNQQTDLASANTRIAFLKGLIDDLQLQLEQYNSRDRNKDKEENSDGDGTAKGETLQAWEAVIAVGREMIERYQPADDMTPDERAQCGISKIAFENALKRFETQVKVVQSLDGKNQDSGLQILEESNLATLVEHCEEDFRRHCRCTDVETAGDKNDANLSTIQALETWIAGIRQRIEGCRPPASITPLEEALCSTAKIELEDALRYLEDKLAELRSSQVERVDARLQALTKGEAMADVIRCEAEVVGLCRCSTEGEAKEKEDNALGENIEKYTEAMVALKRKMDECPQVAEFIADNESSCVAAYRLLERRRAEIVAMIQGVGRGRPEDEQVTRKNIKKKVQELEEPLNEFQKQCRFNCRDDDKVDKGDEENTPYNESEHAPPETDSVAPTAKELEKRREVSNLLGSIINTTLDYIIGTVSKIDFIQIPESISGMHRYKERIEGDPHTFYELPAIIDLWSNVMHLYEWFVFLKWPGSAAGWKPSGLLMDRDDELAKDFHSFKAHLIQAEATFKGLFVPLEEEQSESDASEDPPKNSDKEAGQETREEKQEKQSRNSPEILDEWQRQFRRQTYNLLGRLINQIRHYAGETITRSSITDIPNFPFTNFPSYTARDELSPLTTLEEIAEQERNLFTAIEWFVSVNWPSPDSNRWPGLDPAWQPSGSDPETPNDKVGKEYRDFKTRAEAAQDAARAMRENNLKVLGDDVRRTEAYHSLAQLINDILTYMTETITTYPIMTRPESHSLIPRYQIREDPSPPTTNEEVSVLWEDIDQLFEWILTVNWLGVVNLRWPGTDPNWRPSGQTPETHEDHVGSEYQRMAERAGIADRTFGRGRSQQETPPSDPPPSTDTKHQAHVSSPTDSNADEIL